MFSPGFAPVCLGYRVGQMGLRFGKHQSPGRAEVIGGGRMGDLTDRAHQEVINYLIGSFFVRNLVSKSRRRLLVEGYDLDMSYITDRLLAMSFPAERMRAVYRNPLWQVKSVLDMRHPGHYKIYNLCIEEEYNPMHFHGRVETCPFDDNHVPPLHMIKLFCESVHAWLSSDPKNVVVIHCMVISKCSSTNRSAKLSLLECLMVCAYLVYSGLSAEEALQLYAQRRTTNNEGVSIPSQWRYVGYWATTLSFPKGLANEPPNVSLPPLCSRELRRIRLYDTIGTESVFFVISELQEVPNQLYRPAMEVTRGCCRPIRKGFQRTNSPRYFLSFHENDDNTESPLSEEPRLVVEMDTESPVLYKKTCLEYYFDKPLHVTGDIRVIFYQKMKGGRLFYACFNTAFIFKGLLQEMDKVASMGRFICGDSFCLELLFGPARSSTDPSLGDDS